MVKFKVYVTEDDLKEVNISSLLFDSGNVICDLTVGNVRASLIVNGEIRILNERDDEVYKNYSQYPKELMDLIMSGKDDKELWDNVYVLDMNNWFELFVDKIDENGEIVDEICYEVADIEGELDNNNLIGSLFKFMVDSLKDFTEDDDFDTMAISGSDNLILKENIKNAYKDYKTLAMIKNNVADEQVGRELYMNSNHNIMWLDMAEDSNYQILVEMRR